MANTGTFRSALNGFNREDVAAYLEKSAERYNALKEEKIQLKKQVAELEEQLREQGGSRSRASELSVKVSMQEQELASLRAEVAELRTENAELNLRVKEAENRAFENADKVTEYESLCQRLATLELDASRRAVEIERSAETHAQELRQAAHEEEAVFSQRRDAAVRAYQQTLNSLALSANLTAKLVDNELGHMRQALKEIAASIDETMNTLEPPAYIPPELEADAPEGAE